MNFFDFGGNGFNFEDIAWYFTFFVTIVVPFLVILYRKSIVAWWTKRREKKAVALASKIVEVVQPLLETAVIDTRKEIEAATKSIQPGSNGGESLTDLHNKVDVVIGQQSLILATVEQNVRDLRKERERLDDHLSYHIEHPPMVSKIA